jgi:hypothetical protein
VKFIYCGSNVEAVIDRPPTARIIAENTDGSVMMTAESYETGIDMWLKTQGNWV